MIATTTASLLRGEEVDELGDEIDSLTVAPGFASFPISIIEVDASEYEPDSNTWRTVRVLVGRTSARISPEPGDRIRDLRDGVIYSIGEITETPRGLSGRSSVTLALKRTGP